MINEHLNSSITEHAQKLHDKLLDAVFEHCAVYLFPDFEKGSTIRHTLAQQRDVREQILHELEKRLSCLD